MKLTKVVNESTDRMSRIVSAYKKQAQLSPDAIVTEATINPELLDRISENFACSRATLKERLLQEAADAETEVVTLNDIEEEEEEIDEIEEALDLALKQSKSKHGKRMNVMLLGRAGFAKSDIVEQWCDKHNLNMYPIDLSTISPEFFGGIMARDANDPNASVSLPPKKLIDKLSTPNTVIFFDEYNRAKDAIRAPLHTLLTKYRLADDREPSGWKDFRDTLLFCVAAANPSGAGYRGAKPFEASENTRFISPKVSTDPAKQLRYLKHVYTDIINDTNADEDERRAARGKLALATALLTDPDFKYTTDEEEEDNVTDIQRGAYKPLNYRSFHDALELSEGKKDLLIKRWTMAVTKDKLGMIENILTDYKDIVDKANDAVTQDDTDSEVFVTRKSNRDKLKSKNPNFRF